LLNTINNPMTLVVSEVSSDVGALFLTILFSAVVTVAVFTPMTKPVFPASVFGEVAFVFGLFAPATAFHFCTSCLVSCSQQRLYPAVFRYLFLRPSLVILIPTAYTDLPVLSASSRAVVVGYNFFSRLISFFDQSR